MANCLDCTQMSLEEILRLVAICDAQGNVAWRTKQVSYTEDCADCSQYTTIEEMLRKSLYCDDDGLYYIQIVIPT